MVARVMVAHDISGNGRGCVCTYFSNAIISFFSLHVLHCYSLSQYDTPSVVICFVSFNKNFVSRLIFSFRTFDERNIFFCLFPILCTFFFILLSRCTRLYFSLPPLCIIIIAAFWAAIALAVTVVLLISCDILTGKFIHICIHMPIAHIRKSTVHIRYIRNGMVYLMRNWITR